MIRISTFFNWANLKLNRKILIVIVTVLLVSLVTSAVVNLLNFRRNYTEALITGSFGLGQSLHGVVREMLDLGLPLDSFCLLYTSPSPRD